MSHAPGPGAGALLSTVGIAKSYGAVVALSSVDLHVAPGQVHALLGANGAGKSTLVKILTGVLRPDSGRIVVAGDEVQVRNPAAAAAAGLATVFQDPALVPDLTLKQNLRLTRSDADLVRAELERFGLGGLDLSEHARDVPLPHLRMLDLARALAADPQVLLLDEITAALPPDLSDHVFATMARRAESGRSVLFISHRLAEVRAHCDMCTVLRDGHDVDSFDPRSGGEQQIVRAMLGEAAAAPQMATRTAAGEAAGAGTPRLEVRQVSLGRSLRDVSFAVRAGEVLGLAALEGQGQDALFDVLSGVRRPGSGELLVAGRPLRARHPYDAVRAGVVLVPSDRVTALLPQRPVVENIAAPLYNRTGRWGPIDLRRERARVGSAVDRLSIDVRAAAQVRRLSGGNQQKVTIARWLAGGFSTLLLFDPTRGIDIGTKRQIYALVRELADGGAAVLLFTSELREVALVCDRAAVLHDGGIVAELPANAGEEALLTAAHGLQPAGRAPGASS